MPRRSPVRDPEVASLEQLRDNLQAGALVAARALLGCILERRIGRAVLRARIVETEAYSQDDPASHCYGGQTPRNAPMFGRAGLTYVYVSYGMHRCMNVVAGVEGTGEAALLRAVEPLQGIDRMIAARGWQGKPVRQLANGPGKLCAALSIGLEHNWVDLLADGELRLIPGRLDPQETIIVTPRIGISKAVDWPRRFAISGNLYLSRRG
jgi:DNA-3-methyladenine glycosylase